MSRSAYTARTLAQRERGGHEHYRVPEFLVGMGFRCRLADEASATAEGWHRCERYYAASIAEEHRPHVAECVRAWTAAIRQAGRRSVRVHDLRRPHFSPDEALAIGMIAAAQHGAEEALRQLAHRLTASADATGVLAETRRLADALLAAGQGLRRASMAVDHHEPEVAT